MTQKPKHPDKNRYRCAFWRAYAVFYGGSAIPVIKTGYNLMQVDSADTASQIVFAGIRFTLAGILVLIFASVRERKIMLPNREILKYAVPVCLAQTVGQYFFFYIGVAHTSGVKGGIITGLGNFYCNPFWPVLCFETSE